MTTKSTRGPWHVGLGNGEGSIFADEGRMRMETGGTTLYPIATACRGWNEAEDESNARLIAAAPELLQALEEIVAEWDAGNIGRLTTIPGTPGWEESVGMKWARAAIAKATAE